jgi:predicted permease
MGDGGLIGLGIAAASHVEDPPPPLQVRIEQLFHDLRQGLRILVKAPSFSAAAVALVAMGIGGTATIYSLVHGILSRPAPGIHADGLVAIGVTLNGRLEEPGFSFDEYRAFASGTHSLRNLVPFGAARLAMDTKDGGRYQLRGQTITPDYFSAFGVPMALGRSFTAEEMRGQAAPAAILAYHVWQNQFGKTPDILGQVLQLNGLPTTIVGVSGPGFHGPTLAPNYEVAMPLTAPANPSHRSFEMIGRLAPGVSIAAAQADFDAISARLAEFDPVRYGGRRLILAPYTATAFGPNSRGQARLFMAILIAISLLTLLVVCANVANLILARAATRRREMAVRLSMGASRLRILRILFAEGLAISLVAAVGALLFAEWATRTLIAWLPAVESGARFGANLTPDWRVSIYAVLLAVAATVVFTLAPAVQTWRQDLLPWLKSGEQCVIQGRSRLANLLVVVQIALCFVLLIGAAIMRQSVGMLDTRDLFFNKQNLLLATVDTATAAARRPHHSILLERLRERLRAVPGVTAVSYGATAPPRAATGLRVQSGTATATADANYVGPGYLEALGVPLVAGRAISAARPESAPVALVNRKLAAALWPGQDPVGRPLQVDDLAAQVIGVVPDGAFSAIGVGGSITGFAKGDRGNFVFLSGVESPPGERALHVRYSGSLGAVAPAVRAAIREIAPGLPIVSLRTLESVWSEFTSPVRFIASLLQVFAVGSLVLAAMGLYAVASFYTARRTREFGIRMALGASPRRMQGGVLRETAALTATGVAGGAALSLAARQALGKLLYGLGSAEANAWIVAVILLTAVSLAAAWIPARRAAHTDPMSALRME